MAGLFEQAFSRAGQSPAAVLLPGIGGMHSRTWKSECGGARQTRCTVIIPDLLHARGASSRRVPGLLLFLSADRITRIDLQREWQRVETIAPPGPIPPISPGNFLVRAEPISPGMARSLGFRNMRLFMGMAIIAGCLILALMDMITDYLTLLPIAVIVGALFLFPGEAAGEKNGEGQPRKRTLHVGFMEPEMDCRGRRRGVFMRS